jgi:LEA14-like dessication related protein
VTLNLSTDCISCHTTAPGWQPAQFAIHNNFYPLTGAHSTVNCNECHIGGNYANTPNTCNGCHNADFTTATNPNHVTLNLSTDCISCHTTAPGWQPAQFAIHNNFYPLTGAHATVSCNECHIGGNYTNTPNTCNGCHNADFTTATNPNHVALNLSTDCISCHTTAPGWAPASFANHNSIYPLTGAHTAVNCNECHINGNYSTTPTTCNGCHSSDYTTATNPNHVSLGLSTDCVSCHTTAPGWTPASFAIHNTIYPLTGAHVGVNCNECHVNGNYSTTPTTCNGCHSSDYTSAANPNHVALNLSTDCVSCHTTAPGWAPATFTVHNQYWQLTGAHTTVNCSECHIGGNYNNTPTDCNGCHNPDFNATTNPDHQVLNIPTTCVDCHTTNPGWTPATFAIHNNYFPLVGIHATLNCLQCHTNGTYSGTPSTCIGCHQSEYNGTNNPNHASAGFPNDCTVCHSQNAWTPANWDHDGMYFPIFSGKHEDQWNNCNECHTTPNNYMLFNCLNCHQQNETNNIHQAVSGYQYNSNACFACHPQGEG